MDKDKLDIMDLNEEEKTKKKEKFGIVRVIVIVIGVICIGISAYELYGIYTEYQKAVNAYDSLEDEFVHVYTPSDNEIEETTQAEIPWYEMVSVDLASLQAKYSDVVGWLYFENENISYPVMQASDNDKYLYMTYDGKSSSSGSIFMEASNSSDFSDTHTIIYGHNMKNLSMFGKLKYYRRQSGYYDEHMYFQIFRGNEVLRYQIFSYQEVPVTSFVYTESFSSARVLANRLLANSSVNPGLNIEDSDKIITLSTCTSDDEYRFVVSAVLVDSYTLSEEE